MKTPRNTLEGLILVVLLMPIGIFYILKWIIQGIATIVVSLKNK